MTLGMVVVIGFIFLNLSSVIHGLVKESSFKLVSFANLLFCMFVALPFIHGG